MAQECGPRFVLKLLTLQHGTFDTKSGEYEWVHKVLLFAVDLFTMSHPPLQLHVMFLLTCALDFMQIDHSRIWIRAGGDSSCDGDRGWRPGVQVQPGEIALFDRVFLFFW